MTRYSGEPTIIPYTGPTQGRPGGGGNPGPSDEDSDEYYDDEYYDEYYEEYFYWELNLLEDMKFLNCINNKYLILSDKQLEVRVIPNKEIQIFLKIIRL